MIFGNAWKKFLITLLVGVSGIFFFTTAAHAAAVLFEIHSAIFSSSTWGRPSATTVHRIAQEYTPQENQTLCTVKHQVRESGATDNIILLIYRGGLSPEAGVLIAEKSLSASVLPTVGYTTFDLDSCVSLESGTRYFFVFTRSAPTNSNGYISKYRNGDEFPNSAHWWYQGGAFVGGAGWKKNSSREWSLRLEGPEAKEPVIIVPGIMGSRLNRVSDGEEVWTGGTKLLSKTDDYLNDLILDDLGQQLPGKEIKSTEIIESELGKIVYSDLVQIFIDQSYSLGIDLFTFPYDWRLDITDNISELENIVNQALSNSFTGKVNIIAHSMGGLLIKEYLSQQSDTSSLNKLILVGVPQLGAPKAFKTLNYGDNMGFQVGSIDILNPERVKIITQNMPGVYQLLPSREYIDVAGGYVRDFRDNKTVLSYDETETFMTADPDLPDYRNPILLNSADQFHQALDSQPIGVASIYNIVGCRNTATIGEIVLYNNGSFNIIPANGDGTVPAVSARNNSSSFQNYYVLYNQLPADHTGLIREPAMVNFISSVITESAPAIPFGISTSGIDCDAQFGSSSTLMISTHSPVELHVYDSLNRHTGPLPSGDVELGIPESNYYKIGDNSFAFVPAGDTYRIVVDATDSGDFDLKVKGYHGSTLGEVATYLNIPIESSGATAELTFTGFDGVLSLSVDENGDGNVDEILEPNAVLFGAGGEDITPPELSLFSPEPRDYLHSGVVPIQFSVSDADSGVALTKVNFDGGEFISDSIDLFFESLGEHVLSVTVYDKAGNPAVQAVTFQVITSLEDTISNLERVFSLGWIPRRSIKNNLLKDLEKVQKVQEKLEKLTAKAEEKPKFSRRREKTEEKLIKVLEGFLEKLERHYNSGYVNSEAFELLRENAQWLLDNL